MRGLAVVLMTALAGIAQADSYLKGGFPACATEALWEKLGDLAAENDLAGIRILIDGSRCINTRGGVRVKVLHKSLVSSTAKVRAFVGGQTALLWTDLRNVTDKKPAAGAPSEPERAPSPSITSDPNAPRGDRLLGYYAPPNRGDGHRVTMHTNSSNDTGFYFQPPLEEDNAALFAAAAWVAAEHFKDSRASDMAYYIADGTITLTGHRGKYRAKILSNGAGLVHGLLFTWVDRTQ